MQIKCPLRPLFIYGKTPLVRPSLISILLLSAILTGCWKEPSKFNWKNAPGAEQYERLMWQAIQEKNWTEAERHLASTFVGVDLRGRKYDRAGWVEHWKGMQIQDFSLGELTVTPNGPDMVVTYELHLRGQESGRPLPDIAARMVSVWQQLKSGWVLIAQSEIPIT